MKSVRLLPVVIFAALALLVFKGIGLVTEGGYVLSGVVPAFANDGGEGEGAATAGGEPMLADIAPMLTDTAPVLASPASAEPEAAHGAGEAAAAGEDEVPAPPAASASIACPEDASAADMLATGCTPPPIPARADGDAVPTIRDASGNLVPLQTTEGDNSQGAILARLGERRADLDRREAELALRTTLLEAAEKKLDERTRTLEALQAQVDALVDQKQAEEDEGFKAIISMYEAMKPKDAARIFDALQLDVLLRVTRAMNPRKMSPILADMSPKQAEQLTTALAARSPVGTVADAGNLASLPQIVGQ